MMNKKTNYNMESNAIFSQFKNLEKSTANKEAFDVISINELPHKLGVSCEGFPKFFVSTNNSISSTQNIIREMLSVEYNLPCFIVENGEVKQKDCFSLLTDKKLI